MGDRGDDKHGEVGRALPARVPYDDIVFTVREGVHSTSSSSEPCLRAPYQRVGNGSAWKIWRELAHTDVLVKLRTCVDEDCTLAHNARRGRVSGIVYASTAQRRVLPV